MIIRRFLQWAATAPAAARADGASMLARAYLDRELDPADARDAEAALTSLLDDGSPLVRMALASELAAAPTAPHHIITALSADRSDIAAVVLAASPLLGEAELVDAVAVGDAIVQSAIAGRVGLSIGVAAALAEVGQLEACLALCCNPTASIAHLSLARLIERFGREADLRELLGRRADLDPGLRHALVVETARALNRFVTDCAWMTPDRAARVTREAQDQACVTIATESERQSGALGPLRLAVHLREAGRLTPALLMRAVLCGNLSLFEAAISDLAGLPLARVAGFVRGGRGVGFAALYDKSGLPPRLLPVFQAAVQEAVREAGREVAEGTSLRRHAVRKALAACAGASSDDLGKTVALLRRLEAEAALDDARTFALELVRENPAMPVPRLGGQERLPALASAA